MKLLAIILDADRLSTDPMSGLFVRKYKNHHGRREAVGTWTDDNFQFRPFMDATEAERDEMADFVNGRFVQLFQKSLGRKEKT